MGWWATLALQEPPAEDEEGWSAKSMMFPSGLSSCWLARSQGAVTSPLVETRAGLSLGELAKRARLNAINRNYICAGLPETGWLATALTVNRGPWFLGKP